GVFNFGTAQRARTVQHYQQGGDLTADSATGTLYFEFESASGVIGPPSRTIGTGEIIRTYPGNGAVADGGVADDSTYLATAASAANENVMDWSALLSNAPQPDGTLAPPSKYQSATKNFFASSGLEAIYGVSGGGPAFYFDGIKFDSSGTVIPGNFSRILT